MIIQLPYLVRSDEIKKRRHEIERQLTDNNNNCGIIHVDDTEKITYSQERGEIKWQ